MLPINQEFKNDILIVAGDLGDTFNAIKRGCFGGEADNLRVVGDCSR
jgi:hypothetical protein